jgi:3-oxoacyl-[acyl-carrier protein] reductase
MDFTGQKAVITGATRGIGRAIAEAFLASGATVIGTYAASASDAEEFIASGDWGERLQLHRCDVSDHRAVEAFYEQVEKQYDTIDILISNAGIRRDGVMAMMKQEDWQRVIDVNLTGTFNMAKSAVLMMLKQKYGRIIFITSPMAHLGFAGQANYSASKAGQIGMMRSLSKETAKRKITVNCVSPGFIETELIADLNDEQVKGYKKLVPLRRFGKPSEVADAVMFLASDKAAYITGSVLDINGGI